MCVYIYIYVCIYIYIYTHICYTYAYTGIHTHMLAHIEPLEKARAARIRAARDPKSNTSGNT